MPRVSIGLPVYNGAAYIGAALDSLLGQTFGDFDVWVSDNASTDATPHLCAAYAARDARVHYERQPHNRGAAWNYNHVFECSRGEYFKWASHDDICEPDYLRAALELLDGAGSDVALVYPKSLLIDDAGSVIGDYEDNLDLPEDDPCVRFKNLLRRRKLCNAIFGLHRRPVLAATRLIGNYFSSDTVLFAEIALAGKVREIDRRLFKRRIHAGTSCNEAKSIEDIAVWFDPANRGRRLMPFRDLFVEHLRAIRRADLGFGQRLRCYGSLLRSWIPSSRIIAGEYKALVKRRLGLASAQPAQRREALDANRPELDESTVRDEADRVVDVR